MQYINTFFVYDVELKRDIKGHKGLFTLFTYQPTKVATVTVRVLWCVRIYYVRTLVGTIVRFEVGPSCNDLLVEPMMKLN